MTAVPLELRYPISNTSPAPLIVVVEPWADEVLLLPGEECVLTLRGTEPPRFHIELSAYGLILYAESDWTFEIHKGGVKVA